MTRPVALRLSPAGLSLLLAPAAAEGHGVAVARSGAVSDYANGSRRKDELTLGYRLESGAGVVLVDESEKQKAKSDGEDLLTPVVQHAAESVVAAAAR